jgi:hypothetical protein
MVTLEALLLRASSPDWADRLAMIAVNPRDAEHRRPHLAGPSRPPAYYRDVILPDPPTGRVLVDQVVREETMEQQMPVRTTPSAHPHPTYQRWHVAANYVVPFPSGR